LILQLIEVEMSVITPPAELAAARERNHAVWRQQTELLFAKRIEDAFSYWHSDARYEAAYPIEGLPAVVEGRDALIQMFAALLAAGERIESQGFRFHQTDDPDTVFVEERFVMDLIGGGDFENRVVMRVTFRDGLIAEMLEYADRRAMEDLLHRLRSPR
jgi:ketosteroid isomerase-like protein